VNAMTLYRSVGFVLAVTFAAVGLDFLLAPNDVIRLFNAMSERLGVREAPTNGAGFYLVLAVAYMYVVAILAWHMFLHPENRAYPTILAHAKLASAALSFALFIGHQPYLIYLANGVVDGFIGMAVWLLNRSTAVERAREQIVRSA